MSEVRRVVKHVYGAMVGGLVLNLLAWTLLMGSNLLNAVPASKVDFDRVMYEVRSLELVVRAFVIRVEDLEERPR